MCCRLLSWVPRTGSISSPPPPRLQPPPLGILFLNPAGPQILAPNMHGPHLGIRQQPGQEKGVQGLATSNGRPFCWQAKKCHWGLTLQGVGGQKNKPAKDVHPKGPQEKPIQRCSSILWGSNGAGRALSTSMGCECRREGSANERMRATTRAPALALPQWSSMAIAMPPSPRCGQPTGRVVFRAPFFWWKAKSTVQQLVFGWGCPQQDIPNHSQCSREAAASAGAEVSTVGGVR